MSKNNRLALILLGVFSFTWIIMLGFFTKEGISKETEVKTVAVANKNINSSTEKLINKGTIGLKKTYTNQKSKKEENLNITTPKVQVSNIAEKASTNKNNSSIPNIQKSVEINNTIIIEDNNELKSNYLGYETIAKIEIPKTSLNTYILKNQTVSGMEIAPCLVYSKGDFNKSGFHLIAGHNYRNGKLFSNNNKINIGDKIYITTLDGNKVTYTVKQKFVTTPEDVSYLNNYSNSPKLILQSCTDDENGRIIIIAE